MTIHSMTIIPGGLKRESSQASLVEFPKIYDATFIGFVCILTEDSVESKNRCWRKSKIFGFFLAVAMQCHSNRLHCTDITNPDDNPFEAGKDLHELIVSQRNVPLARLSVGARVERFNISGIHAHDYCLMRLRRRGFRYRFHSITIRKFKPAVWSNSTIRQDKRSQPLEKLMKCEWPSRANADGSTAFQSTFYTNGSSYCTGCPSLVHS